MLDKSGLHAAVEGSLYSVEEVVEWCGRRGAVVNAREEDDTVRVDFSTELMKRLSAVESELEDLRSVLRTERMDAEALRADLDKERVRRVVAIQCHTAHLSACVHEACPLSFSTTSGRPGY